MSLIQLKSKGSKAENQIPHIVIGSCDHLKDEQKTVEPASEPNKTPWHLSLFNRAPDALP